jgi:hypothetical protein
MMSSDRLSQDSSAGENSRQQRRAFSVHYLPLLFFVVGLASLFLGPVIVHHPGHIPEDVANMPWLHDIARSMSEAFHTEITIEEVAGLGLVLVGALCLCILSWSRKTAAPDRCHDLPARPAETNAVRRWLGGKEWKRPLTVSLVVCLLSILLFITRLLQHDGSWVIVAVWLVMQCLFLVPALILDGRFGTIPRLSVGWHEWLFLALLIVVVTIVTAWDLNSWRYSCIGDEWSIHQRAVETATSPPRPELIFGSVHYGVDGEHAPIETYFHSTSMRILGLDNLGWRLSVILLFPLGLAPLYLVARVFVSRHASAVTVLVVGFSHCLIAESHTGYGIAIWRTITLLVLAALVITCRSRSLTAAVVLGLTCSYASLIRAAAFVMPFLAIAGLVFFFLLKIYRKWRLGEAVKPLCRRSVAVLATVLVVFTITSEIAKPFYRHPDAQRSTIIGDLLWKTSLGGIAAHYFDSEVLDAPQRYDQKTPEEFLTKTSKLTWKSMLAPLVFRSHSHYVVGLITDPISCSLIFLGMLASICWFRRWHVVLYLWAVYLTILVLTCVLSQYDNISINRIHALVPFWGIFAGIGFQTVMRCAGRVWETVPRLVVSISTVLIGLAIIALNLNIFYLVMPSMHLAHQRLLGMRALQEAPASGKVYYMLDGWHPLEKLSRAYPYGDKAEFITTERFLNDLPWRSFNEIDRFAFNGRYLETNHRHLFDRFLAMFPGSTCSTQTDGPEQHSIQLCRLAPERVGQPPWETAIGQIVVPSDQKTVSLGELLYARTPDWDLPRWGRTIDDREILVNGAVYSQAYASNTPLGLYLYLPPGFDRFEVGLGIDNRSASLDIHDTATFEVYLDNEEVFQSDRMHPGDPIVPVSLDISGARVLCLQNPYSEGDHASEVYPVWIEPVLIRKQ